MTDGAQFATLLVAIVAQTLALGFWGGAITNRLKHAEKTIEDHGARLRKLEL